MLSSFQKIGLFASTFGQDSDSGLISLQERQFFDFIATYGKTYGTVEEYNYRLGIFAENLAFIEEHNSENDKTSTVGINKFADFSPEEMKKLLGYKGSRSEAEKNYVDFLDENTSLDVSIDWRKRGAVTRVKNQGQCGSCWAFSTTGSMEGAHFLSTGNLVELSEQNLVDCSWLNHGCNGGLMDNAFKYAEAHPLMTEADYPYTANTGLFKCKYDKSKGLAKVTNFADVKPNDTDQLIAALSRGPVSVAIEADQKAFQFYTGGVLSHDKCGTNLDHGVLVVGYGLEKGERYFMVKNSWGPDWGDKGYIKLESSTGAGTCGLNLSASIPSTD
eukprot:CAMPEP_0168619034 /NCGR_PEP_ID=MMETSP0449_2-20121227/6389_1 /TAXON_ID=1082188 /ORGANISM="Strombidium rassoulzadegani, Strain ras09" /LENGTH=330 /DNA_ID=CAMNT_0008659947 /DNA_START=12 /DNA_END=1004 /DNA_ORIENTATION=+